MAPDVMQFFGAGRYQIRLTLEQSSTGVLTMPESEGILKDLNLGGAI